MLQTSLLLRVRVPHEQSERGPSRDGFFVHVNETQDLARLHRVVRQSQFLGQSAGRWGGDVEGCRAQADLDYPVAFKNNIARIREPDSENYGLQAQFRHPN